MQINENDSQTNQTLSATTTWEHNGENTPVYAVLSAVADAEGVDPVALPPLYETIDPEALNTLFTARPEAAVETVTFQYTGYDVVVRGNGEVEVRAAPQP